MKAYTDLEQSKKLAEILPLESADMIWYGTYCGMDSQYHLLSDEYNEFGLIAINKEFCKTLFKPGDEHVDWLPCWSLAALLEFIPNVEVKSKVQNFDSKNWCISSHDDKDYNHIWVYNDELIDACVEFILKLKEKNLL